MMACCCPPSPTTTPPQMLLHETDEEKCKLELEVADDEWTEGTFTLISSDNVRLAALPCRILAASATFQSLTEPVYRFTDENEDAATLRRFLTLLYTGSVGSTKGWDDCVLALELCSLFRFLVRYNCTPWFDMALMSLRDKIRKNDIDVLPVFIVAAVVNCVDTAVYAIEHAPAESWGETSVSPDIALERGADGIPCLDPRGMPLKLWELLPQDYSWALSRAWVGKDVSCDRVNEDVAKDFKELIEAAQERQRSKKRRRTDESP